MTDDYDEFRDFLLCPFCTGILQKTVIKSADHQYMQCIECRKFTLIFKTDYLEHLGIMVFNKNKAQ